MGLKKEKVIITRKAQESIKDIFEYTKLASGSVNTAHKVRDTITTKCKELINFSGYSNEEYLSDLGDYKSVPIWNYIIIFSIANEEVRVLNVIHSSKHPDKRQEF